MIQQASSTHCFVCGVHNSFGLKLKFYETGPGKIAAETVLADHFQGYPGIAHGGIVAAMLDEVSGRTVLQGSPPRWMVTAKLEIRYRRPVPIGKRILLEGTLKEVAGNRAIVTGTIYSEDRILLAECEAVLADIPASLLDRDMPGQDWRVFPDEEEQK